MFDFLKKKKEYVSCEWLEYGINLGMNGIYHCCQFAHSYKNDNPVTLLKPSKIYDIEDFFKKKNLVKKMHKKGIINERCIGCFDLKKKFWEEKFEIKKMAIGSISRCDANCIYCYTHRYKHIYNKIKDVPVLELLRKLIKKNLISKDCEISFNNGEPTIMDEFEDIVNLFWHNNIGKIRVHSSGIHYSEAIAKMLTRGNCELIISPDSGNRDLYKKIKNIDKFNDVWMNISKYVQSQNENKEQVRIKYIIIPSVNDKEEYIKEFVYKAKETSVSQIYIDIELNWYKQNSHNENKVKPILELVKNMQSYIEKENLIFSCSIVLNSAIHDYNDFYKNLE